MTEETETENETKATAEVLIPIKKRDAAIVFQTVPLTVSILENADNYSMEQLKAPQPNLHRDSPNVDLRVINKSFNGWLHYKRDKNGFKLVDKTPIGSSGGGGDTKAINKAITEAQKALAADTAEAQKALAADTAKAKEAIAKMVEDAQAELAAPPAEDLAGKKPA